MKISCTFILLLFSIVTFSQEEKYSFDYMLEVETLFKGKKNQQFYLINSKDNSYRVIFKSIDSLNYGVTLTSYDKFIYDVIFLKKKFDENNSYLIDSKYRMLTKNLNKNKTKKYDFYLLQDTIINNESYYHYVLKSNNLKREKRKKIGRKYYVVSKKFMEVLPIFTYNIALEEWKTNKINIPNGIFKETYLTTSKGVVDIKRKVVAIKKVTKTFLIK